MPRHACPAKWFVPVRLTCYPCCKSPFLLVRMNEIVNMFSSYLVYFLKPIEKTAFWSEAVFLWFKRGIQGLPEELYPLKLIYFKGCV